MDEEVDIKQEVIEQENIKQEDEAPILNDEGNVGLSLADALRVAQRKGLLEEDGKSKKKFHRPEGVKLASDLPVNTEVDTAHEREREKMRDRRGYRYSCSFVHN